MLGSATVTWPAVALALVTGLPAIVASVLGILNHRALKTAGDKSVGQIATEVSNTLQTGNNKTIGEMVTEVHGEASAGSVPFDQHGPVPRP
jgi:hypothetical protein